MRVAGGARGESRSMTGDSTSRGDSKVTLLADSVFVVDAGGGVEVTRLSKTVDGMGVVEPVLELSLVSGVGSLICEVRVVAKRGPEGKRGDSSTGGASRDQVRTKVGI